MLQFPLTLENPHPMSEWAEVERERSESIESLESVWKLCTNSGASNLPDQTTDLIAHLLPHLGQSPQFPLLNLQLKGETKLSLISRDHLCRGWGIYPDPDG